MYKKIKKENIIALVTFILTPLMMYLKYIITNQTVVSGDALVFFRTKELFGNILKNGEFPLWNRYMMNGAPYIVDRGAFSPLAWISAFVPMYEMSYLLYFGYLIIGSYFMFLLLKQLKLRSSIALAFALIYETSIHLNGYRKAHIMIFATIVWLPAVIYYIQRYIDEGKNKHLIYSSICLALSFLTLSPQQQLYMDIFAACYLVFGLLHKKKKIKEIIAPTMIWGIAFCGLITILLIPCLETMIYYGSMGSSSMQYDQFSQYAIHPIKALMTLFPRIFGDVLFAYGPYNSSEMDIELFMGTIPLFLMLYCVRNSKRRYEYRFGIIASVVVFAIAASPHIPILGKIIYRIPIVGSFRCQARVLFIYCFIVIINSAMAVEEILKTKGEYTLIKHRKILVCFLAFLLSIPFAYNMIIKRISNNEIQTKAALSVFISDCLPVLAIIATGVLLAVCIEHIKGLKRHAGIIVISAILLATIVETMPYSLSTSPDNKANLTDETNRQYYELMKASIGNGKAIDAYPYVSGTNTDMLSSGAGYHYGIPAINCFVVFNNPQIYKLLSQNGIIGTQMNYSGLYTGFEDIERNLIINNDILSMMGVKYIVDPMHLIKSANCIEGIEEKSQKNYICQKEIMLMENDQLNIVSFPVEVKKNELIELQIEYENSNDKEYRIYVDLCGENYDNSLQQNNVEMKPGKHSYLGYIYTGADEIDTDVFLRIVSDGSMSVTIDSIAISDTITKEKEAYKPFIEDGNQTIYENLNAKDILWVPEHVERIENENDLFDNLIEYKLDAIAYVQNIESYDVSTTQIQSIEWNNNSAEAKIIVDGEKGFVVFSNNYYPGWNVFIDGKKEKIYRVNGLIQGAVVPGGEHTIRFVYQPMSVLMGAIIMLLTIVLIAVFLIYGAVKKANINLEEGLM